MPVSRETLDEITLDGACCRIIAATPVNERIIYLKEAWQVLLR